MAFADRLGYFLQTFEIIDPTLKLQIQDQHPRQMEIAYDAALNFAWSRLEKQEREKGGPKTIKRALLRPAKSMADKKAVNDSDSEADNELNYIPLDLLMMDKLASIICYRCNKPGHYAKMCPFPQPISEAQTPS